MARPRPGRRLLSLASLVLQIQSFQLPAPKLHAAAAHRVDDPTVRAPTTPRRGPRPRGGDDERRARRCRPPPTTPPEAHAPSRRRRRSRRAARRRDRVRRPLDAHPLATKSVTNALVGVTGDSTAQRGQVCDRQRAARYALKGLGGGLLWAFYFDFADAFAINAVDGPAARVALQMALEQFFWVPLYVAFYDLPFASRLNGVPARRVPNVVRDSYVSTLVASAKLWTPANLLVYSTPVRVPPLVSNVFDLAWNTVNSDIAASCTEECPVGDGPPGASRMCPPDRPPEALPTSR